MKISNPNGGYVSGLSSTEERAGVRSTTTGQGSVPSDNIQISQLGAQLSETSSAAYSARASALAVVVSGGNYQVDANAVSAAIIQQSLALGRAA